MSSAGAMPCSHICQLPEPGCWFSSTTGDTEVPTVKLLALLAVPPGVVTLIGPVVAPAGTVAVMVVAEFTVKLALVPLNSTTVAPVKLVPLMVTLVPTGPLVGVKLEIVGELLVTVKLTALLAVPPAVVTLIGPLVAPAGTVAVIVVAEPTVKLALVPLNSTALAPVKLVPLIETLVPAGPLVGVKLETVGGAVLLSTVTATGAEAVRRPAASRATAVRVCEPLLAAVVFHEMEYGAAVTSVPAFTPSSRNWTPATPALSEALAVTLIVPPTAAPEAGDVMLTVGAAGEETPTNRLSRFAV